MSPDHRVALRGFAGRREENLIIRGICCLRPGLDGIIRNIQAVSLLGRFLQHARAVVFEKDEEEEVCLSSADDLMQRNLDRRAEQLFSLREPRRHDRVWRLLKLQLAHTVNACELKPDGSFARLHRRGDEEPLDSQALLLEEGF